MRNAARFRFVAFLFAASPCIAADADPASVLDRATPPDARLSDGVTLDSDHDWKPITDLETWSRRRERVRRQVLVAAGLWPLPPAAPLTPTIHGSIERDGYRIRKVFFPSYPGIYVTGNLYEPSSGPEGVRRPAVLCPHGHWQNGRLFERREAEIAGEISGGGEGSPESARYPLQARCAQLARMGCVVFFFDMVGYADSRQLPHGAGFGDVEAELRLQSAFGLQTYNTLRAYDFLASLPQVDPNRIGVTGASGGGTQTFILCAIDDRPAAAFPAVMVSTKMQGGCVCENASHLRVGTGNIELAAVAAPRPYGMTGADDWTREIMTRGLPELKALWRAYGRESLVEAWCYPEFGHNYNQVSRERMYEWFNRHLGLGAEEPLRERKFVPVPPAELRVFDAAHPLPADAVGVDALRTYLTRVSDQQLSSLLPRNAAALEEFRRVIGGALEAILHTSLPAAGEVEATERGKTEFHGRSVRKLTLSRRESGEAVPAIYIEPAEWSGVVVVAVGEHGKGAACFAPAFPPHAAFRPEIESVLAGGAAVLAVDAFLTGEYLGEAFDSSGSGFRAALGPDSERFHKDRSRHKGYVGFTYGYNRSLIGERVHDVLTGVAYARSLDGAKEVRLLGEGAAASWALLARALSGTAVQRTAALTSGGLIDFASIKTHDDPSFVPGALKYGGMPVCTALCAPGEVWLFIEGEIDPRVRDAWAAAGRPEAIRASRGAPDPQALGDWLAK